MSEKILVTGVAGFIGFHLFKKLLQLGFDIVGIDNLNDYYDVNLKLDRLKYLGIKTDSLEYGKLNEVAGYDGSYFLKMDISDKPGLEKIFSEHGITSVCNLAAQAGVRYSIENPEVYTTSNIVGFAYLLECCRAHQVNNLVFASTSSVYGLSRKMPFKESDDSNHPISYYAATKKSNEMMAHSYSHLFGIPTTGLRFFTVYGPWGRPDMAIFLFTKSIIEQKPIKVFNHGKMIRDFTYIDDIVDGIVKCVMNPATPNLNFDDLNNIDPSISSAPYRIYNIGNSSSVNIETYIDLIEKYTGIKAIKEYMPMQPGDVSATHADVSRISNELGYSPSTDVTVGVKHFVDWFRNYYHV